MSLSRSRRIARALVCLVLVLTGSSRRATTALAVDKPGTYRNGVVVAVSAPGAEAGREILKQGGTAVDAALATALAMPVTFPEDEVYASTLHFRVDSRMLKS